MPIAAKISKPTKFPDPTCSFPLKNPFSSSSPIHPHAQSEPPSADPSHALISTPSAPPPVHRSLSHIFKGWTLLCPRQGMRLPRRLEVWKLGSISYSNALKLQETLLSDRKAHKIPDTLLSLQHPPTYTLGKRRTDHNLLIPQPDLKKIGAELHYTQRGGDITFHGPHQAVLYPIVSLRDIGIGARSYVEKLELTMIELAAKYGVEATQGKRCETGVWVGDRKIGAIGVRISYGVSSHGLAFNIDPDLNYFKHIVPCGIVDKEVTSLRRETEFEIPGDEVVHEQLISCFVRIFGYDDVIWKDPTSNLS